MGVEIAATRVPLGTGFSNMLATGLAAGCKTGFVSAAVFLAGRSNNPRIALMERRCLRSRVRHPVTISSKGGESLAANLEVPSLGVPGKWPLSASNSVTPSAQTSPPREMVPPDLSGAS